MLNTIILIVVSFFAVIGFLECMLNLLESISTSGSAQPNSVSLVVSLSGEIENVPFLLNTFMLQAERINYKNCFTEVVIVNCGLSENTYAQIKEFCKTNTNIYMENR